MKFGIFSFCDSDIDGAISVWNEVVSDGVAFPQVECLGVEDGLEFFRSQSHVGVVKVLSDESCGNEVSSRLLGECIMESAGAVKVLSDESCGNEVSSRLSEECIMESPIGVYILHPNNIGRCGHICNASYAVAREFRGLGIGEMLVRDCIAKAKELGFGVLQFNAVVATNEVALRLYEKLGFVKLGVIPNGFRLDSGEFVDIIPHYLELV